MSTRGGFTLVATRARRLTAMLSIAAAVGGCSDVGDSSVPIPRPSAGDDGTTGAAVDASTPPDAPGASVAESAAGEDQASPDVEEAPEAEGEASGAEGDAGADSTIARDGAPEDGAGDSPTLEAARDTEVPDATVLDATVTDAALHEAGFDATIADGGADVVDSGSPEAAPLDAGDASRDAPVDVATADAAEGGGGLVPCTTAGQTHCVQCQGNAKGTGSNGGRCSRSEALFVAYDIRKGFATAPGPDPDSSCYTCLVNGGALDDTAFPDTGNECEDLAGSFTAGDGFTGAAVDLCLATLECVLAQDCALTTAGGVSNCYCGPGGGTPSVCPSHGSATNGACKTAETNGFLAQPNDSVTILNSFNNLSQPSGKANQFFVFANGTCDQCLQ